MSEEEKAAPGAASLVAKEVAEAEVDRFIDVYCDADMSAMDDEDRKGFSEARMRLIRATRAGGVTFGAGASPRVVTSTGEALDFGEPTGATFIAMDKKKTGHDVAKMIAAMADVTGKTAVTFAKLPNRDFRNCIAIMTLFLG